MKNLALLFGSGFGFLGVALGAFGAHGLEEVLKANGREATWDTAVLYQFVHAGLLLVIGVWVEKGSPSKFLRLATWLLVAGILVFSGSLYLLSLTNIKWLGAITPIGGLSFLAAWAFFFFHSFRNNVRQ